MAQSTNDQLRAALNRDLHKVSPEGLENVVDEATRRVFSARITGAIMEFGHKQADPNFWTGTKYYASGPSSRVRFRRSAVAEVVKVKAPRKVAAASLAPL
jgi:hypothetical protein